MIIRAVLALAAISAVPAVAQVDNLTLDDNPTLEGNPTAESGPTARPGSAQSGGGQGDGASRPGGVETGPPPRPADLGSRTRGIDREGTIGARIATLDKIASETREFVIAPGAPSQVGDIEVTLGECRYPPSNPTGEAFAWLEIREPPETDPVFTGWMVASSPALNALDHPRYDVWVIRCTNV